MRRLIRRLEAAYLQGLSSFDRAGGAADEGYACTAAWLRVRAHADSSEAGADVKLARALTDVMPAVAEGMADGAIGARQARLISLLRKEIGDDCLRAADPALAAAARDCPTDVLRSFTATVRRQ